MTDVTQGQDLPDDTALFQDATSAETLEKFENPELPLDLPPQSRPEPEKPAEKPADKPAEAKEEAHIPAWRLREESEARRQAERRYEELQAQVRQQPPPAQPGPDIFDNPSEFVGQIAQQQFKPYLDQIRADLQMQREGMSLQWALQTQGNDKVAAARQALETGLQQGDEAAKSVYARAMQSHDPYGVIVRWHNEGEVLRTTGGNLEAYKQRIREEALKDPEFQKQVFAAARGQAYASGNSVARPVKPAVASSPSLGDVGSGGSTDVIVEPSDAELFRAATTAKRR